MQPPRRRAIALSDLLPGALGPAAARQGFAGAEIMARWDTIVGREIAAFAIPQKLAAPPRGSATDPDAPPPTSVLHLRVEGAFALEVQHRTAEILERVNAHLGWRCVGQLKFRQGPIAGFRLSRRTPPPALPAATPGESAKVEAAVAPVVEPELAAALERLGRAVLARRRITGA